MGRYIIIIFLLVFSVLNLFTVTVESYSQDILRIHIVANSNSPKDQFIKYQVRDAILKEFSSELKQLDTSDDIENFINLNMDGIIELTDEILLNNGFEYQASGDMGVFDFPTRLYLDTLYPGGEYKAVKINLGEGKGDNWWCVMFPPLCIVGEPEDEVTITSDARKEGNTNDIDYEFFIIKGIKRLKNSISGLFR